MTDLCITIGLLTGGNLSFGFNGQAICSGLVARSLERMGYNFNPRNPSEIMPADLAAAFDVRVERATTENGESEGFTWHTSHSQTLNADMSLASTHQPSTAQDLEATLSPLEINTN